MDRIVNGPGPARHSSGENLRGHKEIGVRTLLTLNIGKQIKV
jgi:hypothetical protein